MMSDTFDHHHARQYPPASKRLNRFMTYIDDASLITAYISKKNYLLKRSFVSTECTDCIQYIFVAITCKFDYSSCQKRDANRLMTL